MITSKKKLVRVQQIDRISGIGTASAVMTISGRSAVVPITEFYMR